MPPSSIYPVMPMTPYSSNSSCPTSLAFISSSSSRNTPDQGGCSPFQRNNSGGQVFTPRTTAACMTGAGLPIPLGIRPNPTAFPVQHPALFYPNFRIGRPPVFPPPQLENQYNNPLMLLPMQYFGHVNPEEASRRSSTSPGSSDPLLLRRNVSAEGSPSASGAQPPSQTRPQY